MSTSTYMDVVNNILVELNEVKLTSSTFSNAVNIQEFIKNAVNRALYDINQEHYQWPFLAVSTSTDPYLGNTYIETVAGTRWYLLNSASTGVDDDYGYVDWEKFTLTTEGVDGEVSPYTVDSLAPVSLEKWKMHYASTEAKDEAEDQTRGQPQRVIRNPDGRYFGLSPIPDKVYRVYFYAWNQMSPVVNYNDTFPFQEQYVQSVLIPRVRYYAWAFKENKDRSLLAQEDWKKGNRRMREQLIDDKAKREFRAGTIRNI
jgi:hypothetical protein